MLNLTPFLRLYAAHRARIFKGSTPAQLQEAQLNHLLKKASHTKFGRDYDFTSIRTVEEYQKRVPLRRYDDFWKEYWEPHFPTLTDVSWPGTIKFFAVSSGTTSGTTKYIPCSDEMNASNTKAGIDLLVYHALNRPKSKIMAGKSFMLGGSSDLVERAPGIWSGDLSGIAVKTLQWWAAQRFFPDKKLALMKNWEEKIATLAVLSQKTDIRMISGVPSWMLIFFEHLQKIRPEAKGLNDLFPDLEMIVHGGVNFAPYRERFEKLIDGSNAELREVYPASEGFIATQDQACGNGMKLNLDHGIFFEFIPLEELDSSNPTRHWVKTIEPGINYAVVLSTCAGLWSYIIGDTVKFVECNPPRLLVTGRTSYYLSAFGEHLIAEEIEDGVTTAAHAVGVSITDFSVGALYPQNSGELGGHLFVIESDREHLTPDETARFAHVLDKKLCERNEDYEAHRAEGFGLRPPTIQIVKPGFFAEWMKSRGKLGGQHKVPRIITDQKLFDSLKEAAGY